MEGGLRALVELLASSGELDAAAGAALEQGFSTGERLFERTQVFADDGASDTEFVRGAFEAAGLDSGREGFEPDEVSRELARRHLRHPATDGWAPPGGVFAFKGEKAERTSISGAG